jgi:hypothetical protein
MKFGAIIGGVVGLCLSAWLLESYGVGRILGLLHHAGWFGILTVIAFHLSKPLEVCAQMNPKRACAAWTSVAPAIAGTVADLTMEMVTQILFTLLALLFLFHSIGDGGIARCVVSGLVIAVLVAASFFGSQWLGLASGTENGLLRLGRSSGWSATANVTGLHDALIGCYRSRNRVAGAALCRWSPGYLAASRPASRSTSWGRMSASSPGSSSRALGTR